MDCQRGFTYLGLLFAVAIIGVALAATGVIWSLERQRDRESELLAIGHEMRAAIGSYYEESPGSVKRYPAKLEDLLKDTRYLGVRRHLRQIYLDPLSGTREWGLITAPEGGIMGVFSSSKEAPIKQGNFSDADADLDSKTDYSGWKFLYRPQPVSSGTQAMPGISTAGAKTGH